jgi:hypothetical protein
MKRLIGVAAVAAMALMGSAGPAAAATTGRQTFSIVSQDDKATVTASGPISGTGKDVVVNDTTDKFVFSKGNVTVVHTPGSSHESFNPQSCTGTFTERGTFQITGGTGKYKGATGSGTYDARGTFVGTQTPDGCSDAGSTFVAFVNAKGTATVK